MNPRRGLVYRFTSPSGRQYIGVTRHTLEHRVAEHFRQRNQNKTIFAKALRKYPRDKWTIETIRTGTLEDMVMAEVDEILSQGTVYPQGYNMKTERCGGYNEVMRAAMRRGMANPDVRTKRIKNGREQWQREGHREEMSAKLKEAWMDPEVRERRHSAAKARWAKPGAREAQSRRVSVGRMPHMTSAKEATIRSALANGQTQTSIAKNTGVSQSTVSRIQQGVWR